MVISNFADDDLLKKILLVLLTILISIISYYFIEQPARNKNYKFRLILNKLFLSILIITSCCFFIIYIVGALLLLFPYIASFYSTGIILITCICCIIHNTISCVMSLVLYKSFLFVLFVSLPYVSNIIGFLFSPKKK